MTESNSRKKVIGVLGVGEVGSAIAEIFKKQFRVLKRDIKYDGIKKTKVEVLHVCIPYTDKFEKTVLIQINKSEPKLVIIHSTVKPGTTENIFKKSKIPAVHSPVMGTHPNLAKDILNFKKIIGPTSKESGRLAALHFKSVGIKTEIFHSSQESELAKLLDTTYYGWNIIFSKTVWDICQKAGVDFKNVYVKLNQIYNTGYKKSKPNVIRPLLEYKPGPIGGHCIIANAQLLEKFNSTSITKTLIEENKKF